ncbi:MAG TPA: cell division control protein Cdc6, partial [Thermoplasmatales archaeon]|nr:cell division control protein Cdc6 [Thermoplasmatales archaeon]
SCTITTGEVYEVYKDLCKKNRTDPLTQRRVTDLISELDMLGIITARVISKGRYGRTRDIRMSSSFDEIINILKEDEIFENLSNYKIRGQARLI